MNEMTEDKKKMLKGIIKQLHAGASPQEVKERFRQVLESVSSLEIAKIEEELIKEGMPREEIQKLCDVHMAVFREQLEKQKLTVPIDHPINILMEEHKIMLQITEKLKAEANQIQKMTDKTHVADEIQNLEQIAADLLDSEKHYLREENVLFPNLEKHGITEPPAIMWMEHNQIRERKKKLSKIIEQYASMSFEEFKRQLAETTEALNTLLPSHFFKENNILFPTALQVITSQEWKEIRREFDEIGYCCFTPSHLIGALGMEKIEKEKALAEGKLQFETGTLTKEEVEALLDTLPVDITFVDKEDTVKYFNKAEKEFLSEQKPSLAEKFSYAIRKKAST
jgi:hypothetical protein